MMRWTWFAIVMALGASVTGCANSPQETSEQLARPTSSVVTSTTSSSSATSTTWQAVPATTMPSVVEPSYSLAPIFSFLGERVWSLEAVEHDAENDQYIVYTKTGEGLPAIEFHDALPPIRPQFELIDDGGGGAPGEYHMIVRGSVESFDAYWTNDGQISLRSLRTGADPLHGRLAQRLVAAPSGRILFVDSERPVGDSKRVTLRSSRIDESGRFEPEWAVEFESEIVFALDVYETGVLVVTRSPGAEGPDSFDRLHLVEGSGFVRSIEAPPGLLALQLPVQDAEVEHWGSFETCSDEQVVLESNGLHRVESWHIDTTHQLLTACAAGVPISTTTWCCGMGEFLGQMDSNNDGVEEIFVGGTSVGGGGAGIYSLVEGHLAPVRTEEGDDFFLLSGDVNDGYFRYGCRDDDFAQVEVRVDDDSASADRTFYRIDGHLAVVGEQQRIEWSVEVGTSVWEAHDIGPPEIVSDLVRCDAPDGHDLVGTDGLRIHIRPHALSNGATCEVVWPRPYSPLMLIKPDGTEEEWGDSGHEEISLHWIAAGDFLATEDGRFALLDYFPCSHEGTIKTIYTGRYDPTTGELLEWRRVEPPADYVTDWRGYQRHPDRLVIDADGQIIGELDTGGEMLLLELG